METLKNATLPYRAEHNSLAHIQEYLPREKHKRQRSRELNLKHTRSAKYNRLRERGGRRDGEGFG